MSPLELHHPSIPRGGFRAVIFDFDGTLSLLRRNWHEVMIPMMVDVLLETGTGETEQQLQQHVEQFVMRLNGRQTIYQMIQLSEEVTSRGGQAKDPLEYKRQYHELLWQQVSDRISRVVSGQVPAEDMTVPGSHELLAGLQQRDVVLYLASGTDLHYVRNELSVLGLLEYFEPRVYGALDDYRKFSKAMILQQIIRDLDCPGRQILGFGDGFVEIEEVKKVGGVAIGVASDEEQRQGINAWKRQRLIQAGADAILGDYRDHARLLQFLFDETGE